ncbi:hypothetical protein B0H14DRAFT_3888081 [Mycena olivaceomarginata]|nr:hypothetical protein B0H14DRAFT_3888081 [Mycena olivaceomarginata]
MRDEAAPADLFSVSFPRLPHAGGRPTRSPKAPQLGLLSSSPELHTTNSNPMQEDRHTLAHAHACIKTALSAVPPSHPFAQFTVQTSLKFPHNLRAVQVAPRCIMRLALGGSYDRVPTSTRSCDPPPRIESISSGGSGVHAEAEAKLVNPFKWRGIFRATGSSGSVNTLSRSRNSELPVSTYIDATICDDATPCQRADDQSP